MTIDQIKELQADVKAVFSTPAGERVMEYLERAGCWYESIYDSSDPQRTLINAGRREVIATIKTLLKNLPEEIELIVNREE